MEITKEEVLKLLKVLQVNYAYAYSKFTTEDLQLLVNSWYHLLKGYPKEVVQHAFWKALETYKQPLTLAHLTEQIEQMQNATQETDLDLWVELDRAIYNASVCAGRFGYTAIPIGETKTQGELARDDFDKLWENLNPILKDYCSTPQGLLNLIDCDLEFEKGRFLKAMPNLKQRQKTIRETPNEILKMCDSGVVLKDIENKQKQLKEKNKNDDL